MSFILNPRGHEWVAKTIRSYVDEGHSYHYGLDRWLITQDLILGADELAEIGRVYDRLFRPLGVYYIIAMQCNASERVVVDYGPDHGLVYDYWLTWPMSSVVGCTDCQWFVPGTLTYAEC